MQRKNEGRAVFSTAHGNSNAFAVSDHIVCFNRSPNPPFKIQDEVLLAEVQTCVSLGEYGPFTAFAADQS
jgi:hypothetical protein